MDVVLRKILGNLELGAQTLVIVAALVAIRAGLWLVGVEGMSPTALSAGIITGGVFVMGLVVAGTLADYRDAERAPTDLAAGLYSILRETESMHAVWRTPDLSALRRRLIAVVTTLRADIDAGDTRACQAAIEDLSETFLELDESDVPANYIVRLRAEQAGLRKSLLRVYHLQREEFLPSAYAMIVAFVSLILVLLMFTNFDGLAESLITVGFLSFFFLALLRLLSVISTPFKVGKERTDDDVSLFLLNEFVVQVQASEAGETVVEDIDAQAEEVEEQLVEVEEQVADPPRRRSTRPLASPPTSDSTVLADARRRRQPPPAARPRRDGPLVRASRSTSPALARDRADVRGALHPHVQADVRRDAAPLPAAPPARARDGAAARDRPAGDRDLPRGRVHEPRARSAARSRASSGCRRPPTARPGGPAPAPPATCPTCVVMAWTRPASHRDRQQFRRSEIATARRSVRRMLNALTHTFIYVLDQDEALDFYVGKLGLEVSTDADLGFMRWLTVNVPGQPEIRARAAPRPRWATTRRPPPRSASWSPRAAAAA